MELNDLHECFMFLVHSSYLAPNISFLSSLFCMDHWKTTTTKGFLILQNFQCTPWAVVTIFKLKSRRFGSRCLDCSCFYPVHMETVSRGAAFSSISVRHASRQPYIILFEAMCLLQPCRDCLLACRLWLRPDKEFDPWGGMGGKRSRLEKRNRDRKTGGNRESKGKGVSAGEDSKCKTGGG